MHGHSRKKYRVCILFLFNFAIVSEGKKYVIRIRYVQTMHGAYSVYYITHCQKKAQNTLKHSKHVCRSDNGPQTILLVKNLFTLHCLFVSSWCCVLCVVSDHALSKNCLFSNISEHIQGICQHFVESIESARRRLLLSVLRNFKHSVVYSALRNSMHKQ